MPQWWPHFEFSRPEWLWLLTLLPVLIVFFVRSLVDLPRRQMIVSLLTRLTIAAMLIGALAELTIRETTDDVFVVFAVDHSLSVDADEGSKRASQYIENATSGVRQDLWRQLPFAARPGSFSSQINRSLENSASDSRPPEEVTGTNLQSAVEVAAAGVPPGFVPHVVLLSDGNETRGDILATAATCGFRISTVPLSVRDEPEIQVSAVNVPAEVSEGEPFQVEVVVHANRRTQTVIDVFRGDFRTASETRELQSGENRFLFTEQIDQPTEFSARVRAPAADDDANTPWLDTLLDNNSASGLVFTTGKPKILLIESVPELAKHLEWAMEAEGIVVETRPADGMPTTLSELQPFELLVLSDVPATDLSEKQMEIIRQYVSELGGGLVMLGGDNSFGLGGYYRTIVEDVLPVRCDFEKEKEKPGLGMVIVMDKSGSMGGQKIQLAKEAAAGAVELLGEKDQIGVIAFDGTPYWVSEVRPCTQKGIILDRIASIEAGGGTTLYPAMDEAFRALRETNARLKHVIILTDGYSTPGDFESMTQDMVAARITVSTVGIGDADRSMLERIAQLGEGRYYFSDDPSSIPQIFARETITAGKSAIREEPFLPVLVRATPVLQDVNFDEAPFLLGHVVTRPKATSEVILTTENGDPLLAWWRYGLGMSIAFTSDAKSQWAAEWLTWSGFNRMWAQVIRHGMRKPETRGFNLKLQRNGGSTQVIIDSANDVGQFLNDAETKLTLVSPTMQTKEIPVVQTAPGLYQAEFETPESGAWYIQATQQVDGQPARQHSRGLVIGYDDELRLRPVNEDVLQSVASLSGGRFNPDPATVFDPVPDESAARVHSLWPWLLSAGMVLFVLDVALRRLELRRLFGTEVHRSDFRTSDGVSKGSIDDDQIQMPVRQIDQNTQRTRRP